MVEVVAVLLVDAGAPLEAGLDLRPVPAGSGIVAGLDVDHGRDRRGVVDGRELVVPVPQGDALLTPVGVGTAHDPDDVRGDPAPSRRRGWRA